MSGCSLACLLRLWSYPDVSSCAQVVPEEESQPRQKEQQEKLEEIGGEKKAIGFGSQIRSYVLHPYQMVKDLRTKMETGAVERVLDGDFDPFIKAYLMKKAAG